MTPEGLPLKGSLADNEEGRNSQGGLGSLFEEMDMEATCKHCGERITDGAMICPNCKVADPLGKVKDEAERFREEQVESAGKPPKK